MTLRSEVILHRNVETQLISLGWSRGGKSRGILVGIWNNVEELTSCTVLYAVPIGNAPDGIIRGLWVKECVEKVSRLVVGGVRVVGEYDVRRGGIKEVKDVGNETGVWIYWKGGRLGARLGGKRAVVKSRDGADHIARFDVQVFVWWIGKAGHDEIVDVGERVARSSVFEVEKEGIDGVVKKNMGLNSYTVIGCDGLGELDEMPKESDDVFIEIKGVVRVCAVVQEGIGIEDAKKALREDLQRSMNVRLQSFRYVGSQNSRGSYKMVTGMPRRVIFGQSETRNGLFSDFLMPGEKIGDVKTRVANIVGRHLDIAFIENEVLVEVGTNRGKDTPLDVERRVDATPQCLPALVVLCSLLVLFLAVAFTVFR